MNGISTLQKQQALQIAAQNKTLVDLKGQKKKSDDAIEKANQALKEAQTEYNTLSAKEKAEFLKAQENKASDNILQSVPVSNTKTTASEVQSALTASNTIVSSSSSNAAKIISVAKQYLGVPYVWGGTTPSGWDCSGFTSFVYRQALGMEIGRTTYNQMASGHSIPFSQAQPGDLLIFDGGGHVGIYLGNNEMINAENPSVGTVIASLTYWQPDYALTY
ncbi:peptidoglycan endopeptidase [Lactococcus allomyrinae]|uniref:Peptidoglycan endopeptidase n=2 Tax=Lactococcus allomyrinae TaxID=2419773 RepID=A0A387BDF4_9LACT|nr:peptidoglycan endopeptidase [Lactococcus allomyrinae]